MSPQLCLDGGQRLSGADGATRCVVEPLLQISPQGLDPRSLGILESRGLLPPAPLLFIEPLLPGRALLRLEGQEGGTLVRVLLTERAKFSQGAGLCGIELLLGPLLQGCQLDLGPHTLLAQVERQGLDLELVARCQPCDLVGPTLGLLLQSKNEDEAHAGTCGPSTPLRPLGGELLLQGSGELQEPPVRQEKRCGLGPALLLALLQSRHEALQLRLQCEGVPLPALSIRGRPGGRIGRLAGSLLSGRVWKAPSGLVTRIKGFHRVDRSGLHADLRAPRGGRLRFALLSRPDQGLQVDEPHPHLVPAPDPSGLVQELTRGDGLRDHARIPASPERRLLDGQQGVRSCGNTLHPAIAASRPPRVHPGRPRTP